MRPSALQLVQEVRCAHASCAGESRGAAGLVDSSLARPHHLRAACMLRVPAPQLLAPVQPPARRAAGG